LGKQSFSFLDYLSETKIGIVMVMLSFLVFFAKFPFLEALSHRMFDLNFVARGTIESDKDVTLLAIDQKSQEALGRWPWSRSVMVDIVKKLSSYQPKVIALDIVFSYPEERPDLKLAKKLSAEMSDENLQKTKAFKSIDSARNFADVDTRLAEVFKRSGNVVPGYFFFTVQEEVNQLNLNNRTDYKIIRKSRYKKIKYPKSGKKNFPLVEAVGVKPNIKKLTKAAKLTGYFNIFPDDDGITRRFVNVVKFEEKLFPSAVMQMLRVFYDNSDAKITFEDLGVADLEIGDKKIPVDEYGRSLINYYGAEGEFERVPIIDLLNAKKDDLRMQQAFSNKIVIVGATAMGIFDIRNTPFGLMAGPEVEATFIQNVIDGIVPRQAGWHLIFGIVSILLTGGILVIVMKRASQVVSFLSALVLVSFYITFQRYLFSSRHLLIDVLYPAIAIILVYGGIAFYKYLTETKQKQFIQGAFGQYLSPAVIEQIVADPSKLSLGGARKEMTAFFSDVAGFSTISESLTPEELVQLLNDYLTEMSDILMELNGTVDKFEGDAIIAFFGAPLDDSNHAVNCVKAALRMQERLEEMRQEWAKEGKALLRMRIGINTGSIVVGNMGSKSRMDYTMMGDAVNLAARLEGANKPYGTETMVSHYTYEVCKNDFEFRKLDSLQVVGKSEVITVYEVLALKGELSKEKVEIISTYEQGLEQYYAMNWEEAIKLFSKVLELDDDDGPALTYLERSLDFNLSPPDKNWNGVHVLTSK